MHTDRMLIGTTLTRLVTMHFGKRSEYFIITIKIKSKSNYVTVCRIRVDIDTNGWLVGYIFFFYSCYIFYLHFAVFIALYALVFASFFDFHWVNTKFFWFHIFTARLHLKFNIKYCMKRKSSLMQSVFQADRIVTNNIHVPLSNKMGQNWLFHTDT